MGENAQTYSSGSSNSMDAYSFGTLWQEITRAVGYMMSGITDVFGNRDAARVNEKKIREYYSTQRSKNILDAVSGGNVTVMMIVAIGGIALIIWLTQKNKK